MDAEARTRAVVYREWVLASPAHHTEVDKACAVAQARRAEESGRTTDVEVAADDDRIVIGYRVDVAPAGPVEAALRALARDWARRDAPLWAPAARELLGVLDAVQAPAGGDADA